jgi:futalosine hydrolase
MNCVILSINYKSTKKYANAANGYEKFIRNQSPSKIMKLLITAATDNELLAAREVAGTSEHALTFALTGIGTVATAYHTTRWLLSQPFDAALNIGIAGSFTDRFPLGRVVCPATEYFGDSGVQSPGGFSTLFDEELLDANTFPFVEGALKCRLPPTLRARLLAFPQATGVTVQTTTGTPSRIDELRQRFAPDVETMESAAFFYVCLSQNVPFAALRAVSNKVEVRNKVAWNVPLALHRLQAAVKTIITG